MHVRDAQERLVKFARANVDDALKGVGMSDEGSFRLKNANLMAEARFELDERYGFNKMVARAVLEPSGNVVRSRA